MRNDCFTILSVVMEVFTVSKRSNNWVTSIPSKRKLVSDFIAFRIAFHGHRTFLLPEATVLYVLPENRSFARRKVWFSAETLGNFAADSGGVFFLPCGCTFKLHSGFYKRKLKCLNNTLPGNAKL